MSVLVLGSSGLVGRRLVARLAADGHPVVASDVVPPVGGELPGVVYSRADVTRLDRLISVAQEHDVTSIALLSYIMGPLMSPDHSDIPLACDVNVTGVTNVLEAARLAGVGRVVFLSTVGTYGPQRIYGDRPVAEDEILAPASMYGRMKALNESICDRYAALYGLEVVKVRPSSILGPGSTIWPSRFLERIAVGDVGLVPYAPEAGDNVIGVADLATLLTRLLTGERPRSSTYLASGHNVTMAELAGAVRQIVPDARIEFPDPDRRPSYPSTFDNSRAVTEFGWKVADLLETVRAHLDDVRAEVGLPALGGVAG
ncbi:MAG: NAD(P)-dependent oxidoreductase [Frankiales bacterium]|nr:NAD(P)-dependent oxidoreductase [Frankiales bacterium]